MQAQILAPAAVLVLWSLVMLFWIAFTRFPAMARLSRERKAAGDSTRMASAGGRGQDLDGVIPNRAVWPSHNYTHLMEQPTIFYPTVLILAIMGTTEVDVLAAWIYVAFRIVHSIWQATVNTIPVRLVLFFIATGALILLAVRAVIATLFNDPGAIG